MSSPMSHHKVRFPERRCRSDGPPPTPRPCATAYPPAAVAGLLPHAPAHHHHRFLAGPVPAPLAATPDDPVPMRRQRILWHPAVVIMLRQEA
jgi:hypothetical protein